MSGKQIKVFKIVNGWRKSSIVTIIETFKTTFLGTPTTIKYDINGRTYGYNEIVDLETGEYTYRAYSPDTNYIEEVGTFTVSGGDTFLSVDLKTKPRNVRFIAEDTSGNKLSGVDVLVDSKLVGRTDTQGELRVAVPIGNHTLSGNKELYLYPSQSFNVPDGAGELAKILIFSPSVGATSGYVFVNSVPDGAVVKINNAVAGNTPLNLQLTEGYYTVSVTKDGYSDYNSNFAVTRGANTTINATLNVISNMGTITFTSNESGVTVYLNGIAQGITPFTATKAPGIYNYSGRKDNFRPSEGQVIVSSGKNSPIYLNLTPTPPPSHPAEGTVLETYCSGFDKYEKRANGNGGSYAVLVERNALYCGAPQTSSVKITTNVRAFVTVYDRQGVKVAGVETTLVNGVWTTPPVVMDIGKNYRVLAAYIKSTFLSSEDAYNSVDTTYNVPAQSTATLNLNLTKVPRNDRIIKYYFEFTEWSYNAFGSTNGSGGLITDSVEGSVTATVRMLNDLTGPGDGLGNSKGTMWFEVIDSRTNAVVYTSIRYTIDYYNYWITETYRLPAGSTNILFQDANVTRSWQKVSGSVSTDATWTGATTFDWRAEAQQHFTWKESGTLKVNISLPFSYVK